MTPQAYTQHLRFVWSQSFILETLPLAEMIEMAERADSVGAILDPTLYRGKASALHEDIRLLRALRHVQEEMAKMKGRLAV